MSLDAELFSLTNQPIEMPHRVSTSIIATFVVVLFANIIDRSLFAQESRSVRWAIIAADTDSAPLADLLTAELSSTETVELVEREQVRNLLRELELNASSLVDHRSALRFGQISQADALVLINTSVEQESNTKRLRLRLIDTRTSVRLLDEILASKKLESNVEALKEALTKKSATFAIPADQLRYLSVVPIMSGEPGYLLRTFCESLTTLVAAEFHRRPEFVVLEREDLQRLTSESDLSGLELQVLGATRLLETSIRRSEDNKGTIASCRIAAPGQDQSRSFDVRINSREAGVVRSQLVTRVLKELGTTRVYEPGSPEEEAQTFDRRCRQFWGAYRPVESAAMAEAAYSLAPTKDRLRMAIQQYSIVINHYEKNRDVMAILLTTKRQNELYLIQARTEGLNGFERRRLMPSTPVFIGNYPRVSAQTAEQKEILADIRSIQQSILDAKLSHVEDDPALQCADVARRIDIKLYGPERDPDRIGAVSGLLRQMLTMTEPLGDKRDLSHPKYRAYIARIIALIDIVHQSREGWKVDDFARWTDQLKPFDNQFAHAALLLARMDQQDEPGIQGARNLLAFLGELSVDATDLQGFDRVFRAPALNRIPAAEANQYGDDLLARVEASGDPSELLWHMYSSRAFFRELPKIDAAELAIRMEAVLPPRQTSGSISNITRHRSASRIRSQISRHKPRINVTPAYAEVPLKDAPGPWQEYSARPIRLSGVKYKSLLDIRVDHRSDAPHRGGNLILIWSQPQKKISIERVGLEGGVPKRIGPHIDGGQVAFRGIQVAVGPDAIYVASKRSGFTKLTPDSAEVITEVEGAPANDVWKLAWWNDRLYIGYADAFGSFDPTTNRFELFASSTSVEAKNAIDARGSFFVRTLIADEARDCIWMTIQDNGLKHDRNGFWKFGPSNHQYEKISGGHVRISDSPLGLLVHRGHSPRVAWYDPGTNELKNLPEFEHASKGTPYPTPLLIKVGDHLIGDNGELFTRDGKSYQVPKNHRWNFFQRCGNGFITHYDSRRQTIWYIEPKTR